MNDMVRLGDWISMEKFGADGDVTEINLTTVKVRNWDKTITTIPTYAFVSDSFKNWRGMSSSGVRRIKRHLLIDMHTIGFLKDENIMKLGGYELLKQYLAERQKEINEFNEAQKIDRKEIINGRNMTNIGVFRQYAVEYIKRHPKVSRTETLMVRQLQPTELGLPLEIYCFSDTIEWVYYEGVISDIFDHLMAAAPFFGLQVFQSPSGSNFKELLKASTSQE
jgi:miniconductance mechanosensitive channel